MSATPWRDSCSRCGREVQRNPVSAARIVCSHCRHEDHEARAAARERELLKAGVEPPPDPAVIRRELARLARASSPEVLYADRPAADRP